MSMDWWGIGVGLGFGVVLCLRTVDVIPDIWHFKACILLQGDVGRYDLLFRLIKNPNMIRQRISDDR